MSINDFIGLKKAVSNVNNILTLQTTNAFIKMLHSDKRISDELRKDLLDAVDGIDANTNGFDVESDKDEFKFVAEVKCNIPVGTTTFGAAQQNGIIKDIKALSESKRTSKIAKDEIAEYFKFMVLLNVEGVRESAVRLKGKLEKMNNIPNIEVYSSEIQLQTNVVYIVFIDTDFK